MPLFKKLENLYCSAKQLHHTKLLISAVHQYGDRPAFGEEEEVSNSHAADATCADVCNRLDFSNEITVLVGAEEKRFNLQADFLTRRSKFFEAACTQRFQEGLEKLIRLPEVKSELFAVYLQWAYTGEIVVLDPEAAAKDDKGSRTYYELTRLYILADMLDDKLLRNTIIDHCFAVHREKRFKPATDTTTLTYQGLPESSTLRRLILVFYHEHTSPEWLTAASKKVPRAFLAELLIKAARGDSKCGSIERLERRKCEYHEHDEALPACS